MIAAFNASGSGEYPTVGTVQGPDGAFYGTTVEGGKPIRSCPEACGTVYRVTAAGELHVLHDFVVVDGAAPAAELVLARNGYLYGTTSEGGDPRGLGGGTIFRIRPNGTGFKVIHIFEPRKRDDGSDSQSPLIQGNDGLLYGTTTEGTHGGTVFSIDTRGNEFQILHTFTGTPDGAVPHALLQASDGRLYGTTGIGGASNLGTIYVLSTDGSGYALLHQFTGTDGTFPETSLIEVTPGLLCSTTEGNRTGTYPYGTLFDIKTDGSGFQTLHIFDDAHGAFPFGAMALGDDRSLFGNTARGGSADMGTIFRFSLRDSSFTVLHSFSGAPADGELAFGAVVVSNVDRRLYGTTRNGGPNVCQPTNIYCGIVWEVPAEAIRPTLR